MADKQEKRQNINFRQTAQSRRGDRQTTVWAKANRNLPYRMWHLSKSVFQKGKYFLSKKWQEQKAREDSGIKKF